MSDAPNLREIPEQRACQNCAFADVGHEGGADCVKHPKALTHWGTVCDDWAPNEFNKNDPALAVQNMLAVNAEMLEALKAQEAYDNSNDDTGELMDLKTRALTLIRAAILKAENTND